MKSCTLFLSKPASTGDAVNEDDVLVQVETDKVTIDVRYTESQPGTIKEFLVKPDDTVTVGQEVVVVNKGEVSDQGESAVPETLSPAPSRLPKRHNMTLASN